jgi:nitrogen-specific signal transduction histidine kinase
MRRNAPVVIVAGGLLTLLVAFIWYSQDVLSNLRSEARQTASIYAKVYGAISDTSSDPGAQTKALVDLGESLKQLRVPVILTDATGAVQATANLPFSTGDTTGTTDTPHARAYADTLDAQNVPVSSGVVTIHIGNTPLISGMRVIPLLMAAVLGVLILSGIVMLRSESAADRERIFAGMARESAHQLGTPLSSMHGWIELLRERDDPMIAQALPHMESDIERLERVAHRFERIGRPPRRDALDVVEVARHVVSYFAARVPTLAHPIAIRLDSADGAATVAGDRVLLEWAIESLVKNAIDALAGRGGSVVVGVESMPGGGVRVRVTDDGPGVPRELRRKIFSAGFSTKESGWGIGLALTRRIVEAGHRGRLRLAPSDTGAVFEIVLPG